jgi:DNA-binding transcriptional regulator YhcF (GntR family)
MADDEIIPTEDEQVKPSQAVETPQSEETPPNNEPEVVPERYQEPKKEESVPVHIHAKVRDELKQENRKLKEELAKLQSPSAKTVTEVADKWGVEPETVQALLQAAKQEALAETDAKYGNLAKQQQQEKVEKAFDDEFSKLVKNYPDMESRKDAIKALAFTPQYKDSSLEEITQNVFGSALQKGTIEEARGTSDGDAETIDFSKPMSREQKAQVLANPEARKKWYAYLDKNSLNR